jgi:alpha-methylacyl-CoA racemase
MLNFKVLEGLRVVELAAIGPVPWAAMILADMGADVLRIDRAGAPSPGTATNRGRSAIELDLKSTDGQNIAKSLVGKADVLLEGMRPGALERLGLAPDTCFKVNPSLVIGRMTGWGQSGPLSLRAGHDINYIALTGVLHAIGGEAPVPPLNLVGDYGGGGAYLLIGVLSAVIRARLSGQGRVVDAAMVDGAASLMTLAYERMNEGRWRDERASNSLDGGAPWYSVYETRDDRHMAVGCVEPAFYKIFIETLGLDLAQVPDRSDRTNWPVLRALIAARFAERTREEWTAIFEPTDACVTPVLSMREAARHPHNQARSTFRDFDGHPIPGPAPRYGEGIAPLAAPSGQITVDAALDRWSQEPRRSR